MSINVGRRIEHLAEKLEDKSQAFLITSSTNRLYISGFSSSDGVILVTKTAGYFFIDSRYYDKAKEKAAENLNVILMHDLKEQLIAVAQKHNISQILIESESMTLAAFAKYKELLAPIIVDHSNVLSLLLNSMRLIKSREEIEEIIIAQRIAEKAFESLINRLRVGQTEKQVAAILNFLMFDYGADDISFNTIAASGINSASPHAVPTMKKLESGDFLTLDFGAVVNGYHSDMTRTLVIGNPTEKMKVVYNAVYSANLDGIKAVRAGITGKLLDNVSRSTIAAWGYGDNFGHGLGHGVGLDIHEAPSVSPKGNTTLKEGMVITIEPGIYISGEFGVRIEDMVVVTEHGCENLTKAPKNLITV